MPASKPGDEPDLYHAFGLPPAEAIKYFESKGLKISWNWQETWGAANARAFTVAKMTRLDLLTDVYTALDEQLKNGGTLQQFKDELVPLMKAKGWWGRKEQIDKSTGEITKVTLGTPSRLATIYETNMQQAFNAGREVELRKAVAYAPWWEYSAVMDARTRPTHAAMNGRVFRYDDPIWAIWTPACGFRCRCKKIPRTDIERERGGFATSSSAGRLTTVQYEVRGADGEKRTVSVGAYRDPITGKTLAPDAGFGYNPLDQGKHLDEVYRQKLADAPPAIRKRADEN